MDYSDFFLKIIHKITKNSPLIRYTFGYIRLLMHNNFF